MKKYLLLLMLVMLKLCITNAQTTQGYHWSFGSAPPFNSVPAITGSAGSHTLTLLGEKELGITVASEPSLGLGASCTGPINVGAYHQPRVPYAYLFGLQFNNNPQFVTDVYTIEMTVKFNATLNFHKLIGFTDLSDPADDSPSNFGIYISTDGAGVGNNRLYFYSANTPPTGYYMVGPSQITQNTWHHLTIVRDANKIISCYLNGVLQGTYNDSGDEFLPKPGPAPGGNNNAINFFKDNGTEEVAGSIAKLSIYNRVLTGSEIAKQTFNNICNTSFQLPVTPDEGHQWTFPASTPPFVSVPALAQSLGDYTLATLTGTGGSITSGSTENLAGLGISCVGPVSNVASFNKSVGFEFNNIPHYVYDTYTIELVINHEAAVDNVYRRLVGGFYGGATDYGIYLTPAGKIDFYRGIENVLTSAPSLPDNTWYHLVFVRSANKVIACYLNGTLIGTFTDSADDFIPRSSNSNKITFFKDDGTEETSGKLAKIAIFNVAMEAAEVQERFNNICTGVPPAVSLKSFTAVKVDSYVQLTWTTSSEQNNLGFEVQRSSDSINFSGIGFVNGNGTTTQEHTYNFTDQSPYAGINYYRLKQVDIDNNEVYSSIRSVKMNEDQQGIQLFPNPSRSLITIKNIKAGNQMSVFNSQGSLILRKTASSGQESISVEKLAAGVYMLQVIDSDNNKHTIRFSKF